MIVSGRAYDPAPTAAMAIRAGFDPALAWHMGKIMECGALCAEPAGRTIMGYLRHDHFEVEPLNPAERCTTMSVAAHTLYEKTHPFLLAGPGGTLDLSNCAYEQVTDRRVRVSGSRFDPGTRYTIKLEGARVAGWRSIFIAGARDPIFIGQVDAILDKVIAGNARLFQRAAGRELPHHPAHLRQERRDGRSRACESARARALHHPRSRGTDPGAGDGNLRQGADQPAARALSGRIATAGNIASPFTPLEVPLGQACEFNVYHLMTVDSPTALFPVRYEDIS